MTSDEAFENQNVDVKSLNFIDAEGSELGLDVEKNFKKSE